MVKGWHISIDVLYGVCYRNLHVYVQSTVHDSFKMTLYSDVCMCSCMCSCMD